MLGASVRRLASLGKRRSLPLLLTAGIFGGGASAHALGVRDVQDGELGVGEVSLPGTGVLFVPGSISNANETGRSFCEAWAEQNREVPIAYVNSNMPLTDYPAQAMGLKSARERNERVEQGIVKFIEHSPSKEVEIFAHSAGSKSAMSAIKKYMDNNEHPKPITVYIMGAGSPEGGLEEIYNNLKDRGVEVIELRDEVDPVPFLAGTGSKNKNVIPVDTPESRARRDLISGYMHPPDEIGDDDMSRFLGSMVAFVQSHLSENYCSALMSARLKHKAKKLAGKMQGAAIGEAAGVSAHTRPARRVSAPER